MIYLEQVTLEQVTMPENRPTAILFSRSLA